MSTQSLHARDLGRRIFRRRVLLAALITLIVFLVLMWRAAFLQVDRHHHFAELAEKNRTRMLVIPPERGRIFDDGGRVVADNIATFSAQIVPEDVTNLHEELSILQTVLQLDDDTVKDLRERIRFGRSFAPQLVKSDLTPLEMAKLAQLKPWLSGVSIESTLKRVYPYRQLLAHVVGYVGRINAADLKRINPDEYEGTQYIGKSGIERQYEAELHGEPGYKEVEVDAVGRVVKVLKVVPPTPGEDIHLTLDVPLQGIAAAALGGYSGAVVAEDPNTGAIKAMVSRPSFDPNLFVDGISHKDYQALLQDPERPLFDRAMTATYPPGSTIKPVMALAGLQYGFLDPNKKFFAGPYFQIPGDSHHYRDWLRWGHGWVNLDDAITQSCDVYFYDLAFRMGIDKMHRFLTEFGLGQPTGIDLPGESSGLVPSPAWKRKTKNQPWYPGETVIAGIGQGYMLATVLQLAQTTSIIATSGKHMRPWLVASHEKAEAPIELKSPQFWGDVQKGMYDVVNGARGTARKIAAPYLIAGKTGTAQVFTVAQNARYIAKDLAKKLHDHAVFIGYAPFKDPKIAVAVLAEHGGSGSGTAAPVARRVMDYYLGYRPDQAVKAEFTQHGD
ncbi:penicillin-binding protein 2 [Halothiobacillus sp. DCM-1]|uniref:penicillin-binding protein 2 n=1 Tax=Halothiobacillus sp. DCM-1 TaxID=3112558 RepID=UPI00325262D2